MTTVTRLLFSPSKKIRLIILMIITIIGICKTAKGQLAVGDIAIIQYNSSGANDQMAFVCLANIPAGEVITFTDNGWLATNSFRAGEGVVTWTAPAGGVTCGTVVTFNFTVNTTTVSVGTISESGSPAFSTSGDQLIAYQGTTNLSAINAEGAAVWQADATSSNTSAVPQGLTNGVNCIALTEADNGVYNGALLTGTAADILTAINTAANWTLSSSTEQFFGGTFNISGCGACIAPSITTHPSTSAQTICSGAPLTGLAVAATGTGLTYQWYSNTVNANIGGTLIAGATSTSYTPSNSLIGTTYYYCVVTGFCGDATSDVSGAITVNNCQCPYITSLLINACQATCGEGDNEIIFMNSGGYSFTGSATNIRVEYGSYPSTTVGYTESITSNPTAITGMNAASACGTLFVEGNGASIPANASIMIVRNTICYNAYDWTSLCGNDPIYVIFSTDVTWDSGGNFTNGDDPDTLRYFKTRTNGACQMQYNYEPDALSGGDGAFITFPTTAGAADSYTNTGCTLSAIVLPVTVSKFYYEKAGNALMLKWDVREEKNTNYYLIEKSIDGVRYEDMSVVYSANTIEFTYFNVDENPILGYNYYRLSSVDYDGYRHYHQTLIVNSASNVSEDLTVSYGDEVISVFPKEISEEMEFDIVEMTGKTIKHFNSSDLKGGYISLNRTEYPKGVYVIRVAQKHKTYTKKIIIY